jgi:hypothetical protein
MTASGKHRAQSRQPKWRRGQPLTLSVPEAGWRYFGLAETASFAAAERGEIPFIIVGGRKRVPIALMDAKLAAAGKGND